MIINSLRICFLAAMFWSFASLSAWAQPTFYFNPAQRIANTGDRVCINLEVDDFTDMLTVSFTIAFDSTVMTFDGVQNPVLPGLSAASFTQTAIGDGRVHLNWTAPRAASGIGEDFPDFQPIIQLCFRIVGQYGSASPLVIADNPAPFLTRQNSGGRNIKLFKQDGLVAVGVLPLRLRAGDINGAVGATVCVDIRVDDGFDQITKSTFQLQFDPAVLQFVNATNAHPNLSGFVPGQVTLAGPGRLLVDYRSSNPLGVSVPDAARLFQLCFRIIGGCDASTSLSTHPSPGITDIRTGLNPRPIGFRLEPGQVDVARCVGELVMEGQTVTGATGDQRCVGFNVQGFRQIETLIFDVDFNPAELQFLNVRIPAGAPAGFTAANFDVSMAASGRIRVNWTSVSGASLRNDFTLFELCFTVLAPANTIVDIRPNVASAIVEQNVNGRIPMRLSLVGRVVVLTSQPLKLTIGSADALRLQEVCLDISVDNFTNTTVLRYSLQWNPSVLEFVRFENVGLPHPGNLTADATQAGRVGFDWYFIGPGQNLPNGARVITVCFRVVGPPGACTDVSVGNAPKGVFVEYASTQGFNSGLVSTPGRVCSIDNRGFTLTLPNPGNISTSGTSCLPVRVLNYRAVESWGVSLAWDPSVFTFQSLNPVGLTGIIPDLSEVASGRLGLSKPNGAPQTLADGAVAFELCFSAKPGPPICLSPIAEEGRPVTKTLRMAGQNLLMQVEEGNLCRTIVSTPPLSVTPTLTPLSCDGKLDGAIALSVSGGTGIYTFSWTGGNSSPTIKDQSGLAAGSYSVTVRDVDPTVSPVTMSWTLASLGPAPMAMAGLDASAGCGAGASPVRLDASASTVTPSGTISWTVESGNAVIISGAQTLMPEVSGFGRLKLTITSIGACTASDEVEIRQSNAPIITVSEQGDLSCRNASQRLSVSVAPSLPGLSYLWSTSNGVLPAGPLTGPAITVTNPGSYVVTVTDPASSCSASVPISVADLSPGLQATITGATTITCARASVTLDGSTSAGAPNLSFSWTTTGGNISGASNQPSITTSAGGQYTLTITDPASGCSKQASIMVTSDTASPGVEAGSDRVITCAQNSIQLNATLPVAAGRTIQWSSAAGTILGDPSLATVEVSSAGVYVLTVTDVSNGCISRDSLTVISNRVAPTVEAGQNLSLGCAPGGLTLQGTATGIGTLAYRWSSRDGVFAGGTNTASVNVTQAGTYVLTVTDGSNSCTTSDSLSVTANANAPVVSVGDDQFLGCSSASATLTGSGSASGGPVTFAWTSRNGSISGPVNAATAIATQAGIYVLTVTDPRNSCSSSDSLSVTANMNAPVVSVGDDQLLGCSSASVTLTGSGSASGGPVTFAWTSRNGSISGPVNAATAIATQAGIYVLTVTDPRNSCSSSDSLEVTSDTDAPAVNAGPELSITCLRSSVTLQGTGSTGADFSLLWSTQNGQLPPGSETTFNPEVAAPGSYTLTIINTSTNCKSSSTVQVRDDRSGPRFTLPDSMMANCGATSIRLIAPEYAQDSSRFSFNWINNAGAPISSTASVYVSSAGLYFLEVESLSNGCKSIDSVVVGFAERPVAQMSADETLLICGRDSIQLQIDTRAIANGAKVGWAKGNPLPDASTPFIFYVTAAGTYQISSVSADGQCSAVSDSIVITDLRQRLSVDAGPDLQLTCQQNVVNANPIAPTDPTWIFQWRGPLGSTITAPNSLAGGFGLSGTYILTFTNPASKCTGADTIEVKAPNTDSLSAKLGEDLNLACGETTTLKVQFQTPSPQVRFEWKRLETPAASFPNAEEIGISSAGTYVITVTDEPTSCSIRDTIIISQQARFTILPLDTLKLTCADSIGSVEARVDNPGNAPLVYSWTALEGKVAAGVSASIAQLGPGRYTLKITSGLCSDSTTVVVTSTDAQAPIAEAAAEVEFCLSQVTLSANRPEGTTSFWKVSKGNIPDLEPNTPNQTLIELAAGAYELSYQLNSQTCSLSSEAIVRFTVQPPPTLSLSDRLDRLPFATRDTIIAFPYSVPSTQRLVLQKAEGAEVLLTPGGDLEIKNWTTTDTLRIDVEVCDLTCSTACKTAQYSIVRGRRPNPKPADFAEIPNTITPNQDGLNDAFIIDALVKAPDDYPNARLTVINRWGDVLYFSQPYTNDWTGTTNAGAEIPDGTYFFVLELDLNKAEIFQGHITILR